VSSACDRQTASLVIRILAHQRCVDVIGTSGHCHLWCAHKPAVLESLDLRSQGIPASGRKNRLLGEVTAANTPYGISLNELSATQPLRIDWEQEVDSASGIRRMTGIRNLIGGENPSKAIAL